MEEEWNGAAGHFSLWLAVAAFSSIHSAQTRERNGWTWLRRRFCRHHNAIAIVCSQTDDLVRCLDCGDEFWVVPL
jgi:hypothetical protein